MCPDAMFSMIGQICQTANTLLLVFLVYKLSKTLSSLKQSRIDDLQEILCFKRHVLHDACAEKEKWERLNRIFVDKIVDGEKEDAKGN